VPAALPWYYTWPLAVMSALAQSRRSIAAIAGFSTWIMVIFKPDGSHGMYSWLHVLIASACAVAAWHVLHRDEPLARRGTPSPRKAGGTPSRPKGRERSEGSGPERSAADVSTPAPEPDAAPHEPGESAARRPAER